MHKHNYIICQVFFQQGYELRRRHRQSTPTSDDEASSAQRPRMEEESPEFMEITSENISESKSRNTRTVDFTILFNSSPNVALDVNAEMRSAIRLLYKRLFKEGEESSAQILVQVFPPNFNGEPLTIPLRPFEQNNAEAVAEAILQANEKYNAGLELFDGKSNIRILAVWPLKSEEGALNIVSLLISLI